MKITVLALPVAVLAFVLAPGCSESDKTAGEPTALELAKLGNQYIGEHCRDKIVQIRAEKSVGGLYPSVWHVVYFDHTAPLKAVQVKFGGGKMMNVDRPLRLLEPIFGQDQPLLRARVRIDSDKAIKIALKEPVLANVKVTATAPRLERGGDGMPAWKVRLWAARQSQPAQDVELGEVILSAESGKVQQSKIEISRVN